MNTRAVPQTQSILTGNETANDRFKQSFGNWFWGSMIAATVLHFMVFALWPTMSADDFTYTMEDVEIIDLPPEIEIPPPPEQIARPAQPVIAETEIDEDITIAPTTFDENPVSELPPPPQQTRANTSDLPAFTPYDVPPNLTNRAEVTRRIQQNYPPLLRDSGIEGKVILHIYIDENGVVLDQNVYEQSGYKQFDDAALAVIEYFKFTPAKNRDVVVPVWIAMPIVFNIN